MGLCEAFLREGALINGVPVVVGSRRGELSVGSSARSDVDTGMPGGRLLERGRSSCKASADLEYCPLLDDRVEGMSLLCVALKASSPDADSPRFLFNRATAGIVGVPGMLAELRFSPSSSLCFRIFFRRSSQVLFIASLSYSEKGRGGCLRALEEPVKGGGSGDSGSSMASGEL